MIGICPNDAAQVIKLSAHTNGPGSCWIWRGRMRGGGGEAQLDGVWVRTNFKGCVSHLLMRDHHLHTLTDVLDRRSFVHRYFRRRVQAAAGRFVHIPTGKAQHRPALGGSVTDNAAPGGIGITETDRALTASVLSAQGAPRAILTAECPRVAYPQGAADFCAAYGLASAMHEFGDKSAAAAIAACAHAALATDDAFGQVTDAVRTDAAGWSSKPLTSHDPLATLIAEPVNLQLVGSDGAGTHSVATLGGYIFDAAETHALPLSHAALDRCVGAHLNGARFSHVARAVRLVPGKSVRAWLRNSAA